MLNQRLDTLRATCWAVATGTSPRTVTSWSPMGRTKKVVVPSSEDASAVREGDGFGSTKTDMLASPSVRTICDTGCARPGSVRLSSATLLNPAGARVTLQPVSALAASSRGDPSDSHWRLRARKIDLRSVRLACGPSLRSVNEYCSITWRSP